jgi:hypothetical protein
MVTPNWQGKKLDLIKEACRHGELKLAAQVQIAASADQRATVLAGIYVAAATGVIGAVAAVDVIRSSHPLAAAGTTAAIAFLVAAVLCILATLPTDFWVPGNYPAEWYADIEANPPLEVAIGEQASHFDNAIRENNKVLERNARRFLWGAAIGIGAPFIGILVAGLTCLFWA